MKNNNNFLLDKIKRHIPNMLTTLRLGAVPVFCALTLTGKFLPATLLFGGACATDAIDGYLARHWKVESAYGKFVDPLADKLLVMSALLLSCNVTKLLLIPFVMESLIAITNLYVFGKNLEWKKIFNPAYLRDIILKKEKVKVNESGRKKTILLMSTVSLGLLNNSLNLPLESFIDFLVLITVILETDTLQEYIYDKIIDKKDITSTTDEIKKTEDKSNSMEKVIENTNKLSSNYDKNEMKRQEKINYLNKEKEVLTKKENEKKLNKTKRFQ